MNERNFVACSRIVGYVKLDVIDRRDKTARARAESFNDFLRSPMLMYLMTEIAPRYSSVDDLRGNTALSKWA